MQVIQRRKEKVVDYIFDNDRPIYIQLVEKLKIEIISGKLKIGERLPSVRELALMVKVNPNTMQKALVELENQKLIYTERTNGKFVTNDFELIEKVKKELAGEKIKDYLKSMEDIGFDRQDAIVCLQEFEDGGGNVKK